MDLVNFLSGFLGGGLLGIWYAARLRHAEERRGIATVVHAELWVAQWRVKTYTSLLKIQSDFLSKYTTEDELRKWLESDEGKRRIGDSQRKAERAMSMMFEYAKSGPQSVLQTDPARLGYLPPHLAVGAAAIYSKVREIEFSALMFVGTFDADSLISLKGTLEGLTRNGEMLTKMWDHLGPQLLREAGG